MKRSLNVIIKFGRYDVNVKTIETNGSSKIVIFSETNKLTNPTSIIKFIKTCINKINLEISGKIGSAIVLIENNTDLKTKLIPVTKEIGLTNGLVSKKDFVNLNKIIKKDFKNDSENSLIFIQPVKYIVHGKKEDKSYLSLPIDKKGTKLTLDAVVTTISKKAFDFIQKIMKNANLKIDFMTTSAQSIPHEVQNDRVLLKGGVNVHIDNIGTYVTINYNHATIKYQLITKGYLDILKKIKNTFNCDYYEAKKLFYAYGNLDLSNIKTDKAVIMKQVGISNLIYRISDLTKIISGVMRKILLEAKSFIDIYDIGDMNITISGVCNSLKQLDNFAKVHLNTTNVILYKPLSYICKNIMNVEAVAVLKYSHTYNNNIGNNFTLTVHTNPNTMNFFTSHKKPSLLKLLVEKMKQRRGNYAQW